ncbi:MAG: MarR family transcriptional regulator, partial [Sinomicrobium sp.]|nr:MarR family transcriptional regulator [Sinomicrobium sp.]
SPNKTVKIMRPRIEALLKQVQNGKIKTDIARILHYIKKHPDATLPEIEHELQLIHQTAAARVSDLLDLGLIEEHGIRKTAKSQYTGFRFQPNIILQELNAGQRKEEKYRHWVKKGLTQFKEYINPTLKQELLCTR